MLLSLIKSILKNWKYLYSSKLLSWFKTHTFICNFLNKKNNETFEKENEWHSSTKIGRDPVSSWFLWMEKKPLPSKLAAEEACVCHGSCVHFSVNLQIVFVLIILQWGIFFCCLILIFPLNWKAMLLKKQTNKIKLPIFYFYKHDDDADDNNRTVICCDESHKTHFVFNVIGRVT